MNDTIKVLVIGAPGSGASSLLASIAGSPMDAGILRVADYESPIDAHPNVPFEVSSLWLPHGCELSLYAPTAGLDAMDWESLMDRFHGICLLIDNRRPRPLRDLRKHIVAIGKVALERRVVLGVTHCDEASTTPLSDYQQWLQKENLRIPVFQLDPRSSKQATRCVQALLLALSSKSS